MIQTFGQWIKAERELRGWTITRCAERAGISWQAWQAMENDEPRRADGSPRQPQRKTVENIAAVFGVPAEIPLRVAGFLSSTVTQIAPDGSITRTDAEGHLMTVSEEERRIILQIRQMGQQDNGGSRPGTRIQRREYKSLRGHNDCLHPERNGNRGADFV